jgi:hypothetical protein
MSVKRRMTGVTAIVGSVVAMLFGSTAAAYAASDSTATTIRDETVAWVHDITGTDGGSTAGVCTHLVYDPTKKDVERCDSVVSADKKDDPRFHTEKGEHEVAALVKAIRDAKVTVEGDKATLVVPAGLGTMYSLTVVNNSNAFEKFAIYQDQPDQWVMVDPGL